MAAYQFGLLRLADEGADARTSRGEGGNYTARKISRSAEGENHHDHVLRVGDDYESARPPATLN
ncbi:hypothetical protein [Mesorhizobium silamurunense]|uniref:hypothetical protein n=1 Tax=Mesorhizobium silamurunense TaxID=499528 RepID=UPI001AEDBBAB|nr:hypothetical protein [Mesorhizobium silamurunense]